MNIKNILVISLTASLVYGCNSTTPASSSAAATAGMSLPANVEVLQDSAATSSNLAAVNMAAFNSSGTDYSNATAEVFLDAGDWQDPLNMADMLVCIINAAGIDKVPNGTYSALVNMSQCDDEQGGSQAAKVTSFAEATVVSTRASNTTNQTATAYFLDGEDANGNGVITEAENMKYVAKITISESTSNTNPFGAFAFNWNKADAVIDGSAGDYERGSMSFTSNSATEIGFSFIEQKLVDGESDDTYTMWAKGAGAKNGDSGKVYVNDDSNRVHKVNFNSTHAHVVTNGTAACMGLAENTMATYVYKYNLYNASTGALIDIVAGVELVFGTGKDKRGYVGSYWDEGAGNLKLWMHTEDGSKPTTVYKESDKETAISVSWSGRTPTISGITLVEPIRFEADFEATVTAAGGASAGTKTNDLVYEGAGQLWGIPWTQQSGGNWQPDYNLADELILTGSNGTYSGVSYRVKRLGAWKSLAVDNTSGACDSLPIANSEFSTLTTAPTITAVSETWASKPTVTTAVKVIHGVKQY
jgi:hypothetical protein